MFTIFKKDSKTASEPTAYVFIGRSGSGKGTQAELFMKELAQRSSNKILHIETGNLLREFSQGSLYIQKIIKELLASGGLAPESVAVDIWMNYVITNFTGKENLVFDGTPRKIMEAVLLHDTLKFFKIQKYTIIYIDASRAWCIDRLTNRQRGDDTKDNIVHRMDWFDTEVVPCIEFFKKDNNCTVIEINGEQSIEAVHAELMQKVFA